MERSVSCPRKNMLPGKVLLLHGNRQTGSLLIGRMDKLRKKLQQSFSLSLVPIDAPFPHPEDENLCTWWNYCPENNIYDGLEESMALVEATWMQQQLDDSVATNDDEIRTQSPYVGLVGFSQGARFVHLLCLRHSHDPVSFLPGLRFVVQVAGYDAPLPNNLFPSLSHPMTTNQIESNSIQVPSLHVWGMTDLLIAPSQSEAVTVFYKDPVVHIHEGGHHIPMRAASVRAYLDFVEHIPIPSTAKHFFDKRENVSTPTRLMLVDEETARQQAEEIEALQAIYPDEFYLLSKRHCGDAASDPYGYDQHISFLIDLPATEEGFWPPHPIKIRVTYPFNYPSEEVIPIMELVHDNNGIEFPSIQASDCLHTMQEAARKEQGMPCVLSCMYAAREFFETGTIQYNCSPPADAINNVSDGNNSVFENEDPIIIDLPLLRSASPARIEECNLQGLKIAETILNSTLSESNTGVSQENGIGSKDLIGKGGSWLFTIGLVGKPSAGKSTFFNTATGFARQRQRQMAESRKGDLLATVSDIDQLGGATMAPHPFTTIDPNIGFCLVPAPHGMCPEDDVVDDSNSTQGRQFGSTHGRDCRGRRLLPVFLKDVAGLVPGAYQGRGRGNQFLNDLTDADVLIHVLDASGRADAEGNLVIGDSDDDEEAVKDSSDKLHPINDMVWIRNELIEWVYTNLTHKWETVRRKGRTKLLGMLSGYGQPQAMSWNLLNAVERYMEQTEHRDRALDRLEEWDSGDLYRLVSAFLGVRFPIALAMNKTDLPSSKRYVEELLAVIPIHGTHVATPLSAQKEMMFTRQKIQSSNRGSQSVSDSSEAPLGTWQCLESAISLREIVLVFPVLNHTTYVPLPGMFKYATSDPSLPSPGMIACLEAAGGSIPTEWDVVASQYFVPKQGGFKRAVDNHCLRDAMIMRHGSTVEDAFFSLKKLGALGGEFVRAEAAGYIGAPPKPIPKHQVITKETRILKIMTNKRTTWQTNTRYQ